MEHEVLAGHVLCLGTSEALGPLVLMGAFRNLGRSQCLISSTPAELSLEYDSSLGACVILDFGGSLSRFARASLPTHVS